MGMAASQARFLGLTARKSNVEYQGQQINQQRTALANQSANLYNQMMELTVPTPPSTSDYYETVYVMEGSGSGLCSDYNIQNMTKTYAGANSYRVTLATQVANEQSIPSSYLSTPSNVTYTDPTRQAVATATINLTNDGINAGTLYYNIDALSPLVTENGKTSVTIVPNQIYEVPSGYEAQITGYSTCQADLNPNEKQYFYKDSTGKNHFFTQTQLDQMLAGTSSSSEKIITYAHNTYYTEQTIDADVTISKSDSGRISSIYIEKNEANKGVPEYLQGYTFSVSTKQELNQDKYDDAMNDYEYEKALYEKAISDINAKTEIIQGEDKQLELRLQQLNTEQNAIATEMDSVSKVIEDNVEKTFKVFA